jgi:hypothetical protein
MELVLRTLLGKIRTFYTSAIVSMTHRALIIPVAGLDAKPLRVIYRTHDCCQIPVFA